MGGKTIEQHFREQAELIDRRFAESFREQAELIDRRFVEGFREQAELVDRRFADGFREQAELIDRLFAYRFEEFDRKSDVKLESNFQSNLDPIRRDMDFLKAAVTTILTRLP